MEITPEWNQQKKILSIGISKSKFEKLENFTFFRSSGPFPAKDDDTKKIFKQ